MSSALTTEQREILAARLQQLQAELESVIDTGKSSAAPVELDQTRVGRLSRMDAMQAQAMAKAAADRAVNELAQIKTAQRRLQEEDFGLCTDCDELIGWPRLQLRPSVRLCIECAEQRET